jgi:fluoride exporter
MAEGPTPAVTASVVAVGGALGSVARYLLGLAGSPAPGFPWPTLAVNWSGAFLLGLVAAVLWRRPAASPLWRPFLGTGVLGGFTTFSAVTVEVVTRVDGGRPAMAVGYVVLTFTVGVPLAWAGVLAGERT